MEYSEKSIGSFEAKTHLSSLINEVEKGDHYIITKRGKPVARLVPYKSETTGIKEVIEQLEQIRANAIGAGSIKELIADGRKY